MTQGPGDVAGGDVAGGDALLYAGSAAHYAVGRVPYPPELAGVVARTLGLDGTGVLHDVGCGPGSLTLPLAPLVAQAVGIDADADMLAEAARQADRQGVGDVSWRRLRAEDLPADLPAPRLVTFAQSFHWMDRPRVAAAVRSMLIAGGALLHVGAVTHEGLDGPDDLPHPRPPRRAVEALVEAHLGPRQTPAQRVLAGRTAGDEDDVLRAAGFSGPERVELPGRVVERTVEEVAASVYSLSSSTPHLFGDRLPAFDRDLRALLVAASDDGRFSESMRPVALSSWR